MSEEASVDCLSRDESARERALVAALRRGDPSAPAVFVERYQGVVYGLCLRMMGHRQDAEDVTQETFLRAFRGMGGFDVDRPLRPWLLGIAANRCRTALTSRSRRPAVVDAIVDQPDMRRNSDDPNDLAAELELALRRLRPDYQLVFSMFHDQGLPYDEIAQALKRPIGTVRIWLHRARQELAEHLARRGVRAP